MNVPLDPTALLWSAASNLAPIKAALDRAAGAENPDDAKAAIQDALSLTTSALETYELAKRWSGPSTDTDPLPPVE